MKILGFWSGHDASYCILESGYPIIHDEAERFLRLKEPMCDSIHLMQENGGDLDSIEQAATCYPITKTTQYQESHDRLKFTVSKNKGAISYVGHHQAHAANAFFSSNFSDAVIVTMDGGGVEAGQSVTACTIWCGERNKIYRMHVFPIDQINIGGLWTRCTRYVFKLQSGYPKGHQAGTVMALAAFGDPSQYIVDFYEMLTKHLAFASHKPPNQPSGAYMPGKDPIHPYLQPWSIIADKGKQERYDLAAGLQAATEVQFKDIIQTALSLCPNSKNLCLAGGVMLNSLAVGKIFDWFPDVKDVYVTPTPHDGGLSIGAAQYFWHHVLNKKRIKWEGNFTPYLGRSYDQKEIDDVIERNSESVVSLKCDDRDVVEYLDQGKIVSIFGGGSESGRRALGNRSILADPRNPKMKEYVNEKVKHRIPERPFAPSVLREKVSEWFVRDIDSPYMSFVVPFKEEKKKLIPSVVHKDGTARLQTVTKNDNEWYYKFLKLWDRKSGVPMLLNSSLNDTEPIVENPEHAIKCFLGTEIDYLYFYDYKILVKKR